MEVATTAGGVKVGDGVSMSKGNSTGALCGVHAVASRKEATVTINIRTDIFAPLSDLAGPAGWGTVELRRWTMKLCRHGLVSPGRAALTFSASYPVAGIFRLRPM